MRDEDTFGPQFGPFKQVLWQKSVHVCNHFLISPWNHHFRQEEKYHVKIPSVGFVWKIITTLYKSLQAATWCFRPFLFFFSKVMRKCIAWCLLLHPPHSPTKGIYSLVNEPLEYHNLQLIGQLPKMVSHGPLGPQLTIFNMEMETHKRHLEPKTRKTLHCQKCIHIGYVGPGFFVVNLVPQTRQEVCETLEVTCRAFDTQQHSKRCCVRRPSHKVSVQTNETTFHMLP